MTRAFWTLTFLVAAAIGLWLAFPSSMFFRPVALTVEDNGARHVVFARETPFGPVRAQWRDDVIRRHDGRTEQACEQWGTGVYQGDVVEMDIHRWFYPQCEIDVPGRYFVRSEWRVVMLGVPLRPVNFDWSFEVSE